MPDSTNRIILCAEDDPDDKELFCDAIEKLDPELKVISTDNGQMLLKKLKELTGNGIIPCLITLDVNMPIMGGKETIEEIKKHKEWQQIPVAIYTTSPDSLYKDLEEKYGIVIITKPANQSDIMVVIKKLISYCND